MATKADIKALLKRGGLTGVEVGRLVLQDCVEVDHGRPEFLSSTDTRLLVDGLSPAEGRVYNQYIEAYKAVTLTLSQARSIVLEALLKLANCQFLIQGFITEHVWTIVTERLPLCVTQEQYERIKAEWTERKYQEPLWLLGAVSSIAESYEEALDIGEVEAKTGSYEKVRSELQWVREECPEVLQELIELVKAGRLKPVPMSPKYQTELRALIVAIAERRAGYWSEGRGPEDLQEDGRFPGETEEELEASLSKERAVTYPEICRLLGKTEALYAKAYKAGLKKWTDKTREAVVRDLERLQAGTLSEEEEDRLMTRTLVSGRELYEAGVSSWVERIDGGPAPPEVYPDEDVYPGDEFAIVVNPLPGNVDEKGCFKNTIAAVAEQSRYFRLSNVSSSISRDNMREALGKLRTQAVEHIKAYLALRAVVETVSEVVGVDLAEDLRDLSSRLEVDVELLNSRTDRRWSGLPRLTPINLERLKPSASSLRYYKERFALSLGNEWETAGTWSRNARETLLGGVEEESHG